MPKNLIIGVLSYMNVVVMDGYEALKQYLKVKCFHYFIYMLNNTLTKGLWW